MPQTTLELIDGRARLIESLVEELVMTYSEIRLPPPPSSYDRVIAVGFPNAWAKLEPEGRRLQSRILRELDVYEPLVRALVRGAPLSAAKSVADASETLREIVDQSKGTYCSAREDVLKQGRDALAVHRENLGSLYDPAPGQPVYVPDANAVVWNPDLEAWAFDESPRFSIVLLPTLLGELDDLKMQHRVESVREKAESAIRRIKEYSRRGDIHDGVTLRRDRSTIRMTAVEPDFANTLPWLDAQVNDDRLIASVVEVVREHPHSPVLLVTRDVNMQNKARHAGIPFVEPPDPPQSDAEGQQQRRRGPRPDIRILELQANDRPLLPPGTLAEVSVKPGMAHATSRRQSPRRRPGPRTQARARRASSRC